MNQPNYPRPRHISTAPKDGSYCLLHDGVWHTGYYDDCAARWRERPMNRDINPTHWMPAIPDPPAPPTIEDADKLIVDLVCYVTQDSHPPRMPRNAPPLDFGELLPRAWQYLEARGVTAKDFPQS